MIKELRDKTQIKKVNLVAQSWPIPPKVEPGFPFSYSNDFPKKYIYEAAKSGLNRDLNPGPPAPEAGIIPLDHWAALICLLQGFWMEIHVKVILLDHMLSCKISTVGNNIFEVETKSLKQMSIWN